jgi:outer membrane receptor for ferrienterochelin and colicin
LQAGFRIDAHNSFGAFALPRLSLMYKISHGITTRIGGGLGYKTPTAFNAEIDERDYHFLSPITKNLKAERSSGINWDVNYKTSINGWSLTANETFFITTIHHAVLYDTSVSGIISYFNAAKPPQTIGFETYIQLTKNALEIYLGYTYTNAKRKYDAAFPHLPLIARNKFASVLAYEFSKHFRAGIEAAHTGKQWLSNGATTSPYLFVAAMMRYNIGNSAVVLNCENLFDYRQNKKEQVVFPPYTNPSFAEIWAPLDGRAVNLSVMIKL